jgi:hypothetical protein
MSSEFTPKFPRSISGGDYRTPLDHPEIEGVAKRLNHLYRNYGLSETHRAEMLVRYALLAKADKAIDTLTASMAKFAGDGQLVDSASLPLGDPGIRPKKPLRGGSTGDALNAAVGFALRLAEWVQRLEDLYGVTAWKRLGEVVNRDAEVYDAETGEARGAPHPGDDI